MVMMMMSTMMKMAMVMIKMAIMIKMGEERYHTKAKFVSSKGLDSLGRYRFGQSVVLALLLLQERWEETGRVGTGEHQSHDLVLLLHRTAVAPLEASEAPAFITTANHHIMGRTHKEIPDSLREWLKKQKIFFVASAPLNGKYVNVSPKGYQSLSFITPNQVK